MQKHTIKVLFAILMLTNIVMILPTSIAQSKPSVPEFTVKLVDKSYDVLPTQSTDPYRGTVIHPGYHVKKEVIEITIKNQKTSTKILYNIRTKGHFDQEWTERFSHSTYPEQTNSQYTVITFIRDSGLPADDKYSWYFDIPDSGQVDFQVEAMSGTFSWEDDAISAGLGQGFGGKWVFDGVTSGWSKTQTITINNRNYDFLPL